MAVKEQNKIQIRLPPEVLESLSPEARRKREEERRRMDAIEASIERHLEEIDRILERWMR
jgi:hypothetical protein